MIDNSKPLVSIVITSYNRAHMIEKAIRSALSQDYENLEIIISDNCSTDNSDDVIRKYTDDPRVLYHVQKENVGMLLNFKIATEQYASGEFITYVSSDDYLINERFVSGAVNVFTANPSVAVYSGVSKNYFLNLDKFEHNSAFAYKNKHLLFNKLIPGKEVFLAFENSHIVNFGGTVFRKEDILTIDPFRYNNTLYFDLQAILLLALKADFYCSDETAYIQTFHNHNLSQQPSSPDAALLNLSFAALPYQEAKEINFLPEPELKTWFINVLRPYIFSAMSWLYKTDREGYRKFTSQVAVMYPDAYLSIQNNFKWKAFKLIYSNSFSRLVYEKAKSFFYV